MRILGSSEPPFLSIAGMLRSRMVFQTVSWTGMVLLAGLASSGETDA